MFLYEDDHIKLVPGDPASIRNDIEDGLYVMDIMTSMQGKTVKMTRKDDYLDGITVAGGNFDALRKDIKSFLSESQKKARKELGMLNKVGYILRGDPGTGKTFLACQIASEIARDHGALAIVTSDIDPLDPAGTIDEIRRTIKDKNKLIILIMDEFEKSRAKWSSDMHSFLDGATSKDNVIVMATVNDVSELPASYTNRPGRFEKSYDFSISDKEVLRSIVTQTLPEKYHSVFNINDIVDKLHTGKVKFGLSGSDNNTIDKIRIMIRNQIADYFESGNITPSDEHMISSLPTGDDEMDDDYEELEKEFEERTSKILKELSSN